jgi:hypothetical protein
MNIFINDPSKVNIDPDPCDSNYSSFNSIYADHFISLEKPAQQSGTTRNTKR